MARRNRDLTMTAADARVDQIMAAVTEGAVSDVPAWAALSLKLNHAADTRVNCAAAEWTAEEMHQVVRLAHAANALVTGRLLGRKV